MTTEREIDHRLKNLNQQLLKKLWWCWLATIGLFAMCVLLNDLAYAIASWVAKYVPSIEKLLQPEMALEMLAGKYFGVLVLFLPIFILTIIWREDIRTRFLSSSTKPGESPLKNFVFVYCLGIPFLVFFLAVFFAAPFDLPREPRLAGQYALHFMIATYPGLLLFGSVLGISISVFSALLIGYLWLPFSLVIHHLSGGKHNGW